MLADALRPDAFAAALKRIGGAHFHATARFTVGPSGGAPNVVTTTTDVWVDRTGNYRFREQNDRDGGREVVLYGRELAVALRYGKMIRRVAEEPEPSRLLEEALGAPFAVFDLVARKARVARAGTELVGGARATVFELQPGDGKGAPDRKPRRRSTVCASGGTRPRSTRCRAACVVDDATGALVRCDLTAKFATQGEPKPVEGIVEVHTVLTEIAAVAPIERPAAEDLAMRQRTLPEQRELLRGLGQARPAAEPPRPGARPKGRRGHAARRRPRPARRRAARPPERQRRERRRDQAAAAGDHDARRGRGRRRRRRAPRRQPAADRAARAAGDRRGRRHPDSRCSTTTSRAACARACWSKIAERRRVDLAPGIGRPARRSARGKRGAERDADRRDAAGAEARVAEVLRAARDRPPRRRDGDQLPAGHAVRSLLREAARRRGRRSACRRGCCARRSSARCRIRNGRRSWLRFARAVGCSAVRSSRRRTG